MTLVQHIDNNKIDENRLVMEEEFQHFVDVYLEDSDNKIAALEIAIRDVDVESIIKLSHSLKGSAANMGAIRLSELCQRSEMKGRENELSEMDDLYTLMSKEYHVVRVLLSNMIF